MKFNRTDKIVLGVTAIGLFGCLFLFVTGIGALASPFNGPFNSFNRFSSWSTSWIHSPYLKHQMVFNRSVALEHYFNSMKNGSVDIAIQEQKVVFSYCNMLGDDCKPWLDSMGGIPVVPQKLMVQK